MVFPQDPEWRREYQRYHSGDATQSERYRSWGTEELLIRCCMKFMPWLRCIHILLAQESQVQGWMKVLAAKPQGTEQPEIRLVFHREFMPEKVLPCFASPCIEMFLKDIPGLAECFIYGNDDMFPLSPLSPEDFFRAKPVSSFKFQVSSNDGGSQPETCNLKPETLWPCQRITDRAYPSNPNVFQRKCMYQQNMIGKPFGLHFTGTYTDTGHIFAAIRKSSCEEVWRRHGEEITKYLSPLARNDRSYNHYIYLLYQQFSGQFVEHRPPRHYVDQSTTTKQMEAIIGDPRAGIVCINDNENTYDWRTRAAIAIRAIKTKLTL